MLSPSFGQCSGLTGDCWLICRLEHLLSDNDSALYVQSRDLE